ncbi:MAG: AAA family ATPase [Candidatus Zhuqueibacterota bacterium]
MIIKSLHLQYYRRFKNLDLELPENLVGIVGSNGSGKTTIVEAIGWCLYGNRIKRTDKLDIRSQFCDPSDVCSVEMVFRCGEHEYRILRQMRGKAAATEAAIYLNSGVEPEAVQERGVNEYVENLLNLDYRSFFISVFARQRDLAALSALQPEERRKSIARLINIEAVDRARNEMRTDRSNKEARKSGIESSLKNEQELKEQQRQLKLELTAREKSKKELKHQLTCAQEEHQAVKSEFEKLNALRDQHQQIQARIEKWNERKSNFESQRNKHLQQIEVIQKAERELKILQPQLVDYKLVQKEKERLDRESNRFIEMKGKQDELQRLTQRFTREQVNLTRLEEEQKALTGIDAKATQEEERLLQLEQQRERLRQEMAQLQGLKTNVKEKGVEIKAKQTRISELGPESPCPVCTRPLKDHYGQVLSEFETELKTLRQQYVQYDQKENEKQEEIDRADGELKNLKKQRDGLLQAREQFKEREKQRKQLHESVTETGLSIKTIKGEITALGKVDYDEKRHQEFKKNFKKMTELRDQLLKCEEQAKRLPDVQQEIDQIESTLKDLTAEIQVELERKKELGFDEIAFQMVKQRLEKKQNEVELVKDDIHKAEQEIIKISKDKDHVSNELNTIQKLQEEIKQIDEEIVYLKALDHHFGNFRQELTGRIRPIIASRASELLHVTTSGRYSFLELDEDYNLYLYDQASRFPLARFSGGEQDLANLCLRIAISQVVAERSGRSRINFIVLDEIFGSQDEQRKELILTALQQLYSQFRQIFIITHIDSVKDALPVVISVTEKSLEESVAVLV